MIFYKDRSFCDQPNCKKFPKCQKALKINDVKEAERLGLEIDIYQFKDCYEPRDRAPAHHGLIR